MNTVNTPSGARTAVAVDGRRLTLTSLDKVIYPGDGTTKAEVIQYYVTVASALLPQLHARPVTRVRWPHGTGGESFFEKNLPGGAPTWLPRVTVTSPGSRRSTEEVTYPLFEELAALVWSANLNALELHVPQWRVTPPVSSPARSRRPQRLPRGTAGGPERAQLPPDRLVVDLDPGPATGLAECATVALWSRDHLTARGFTRIVPVTSGSKGMQLYADPPADLISIGKQDPDVFRRQAQEIAEWMAREHSELVVASMTKSRRRGKVFFDWSQNNTAKTTICPYSLRGKSDVVRVAAPRTWAEIERGAGAAATDSAALHQLGPGAVVERLTRHGDLMDDLGDSS